MTKPTWIIPFIFLSGCATFTNPDPSNVATYCTPATGFRVGYLSRPYYGTCPKETEGTVYAAVQRGRGYAANPPQALPYYARMEQLEKQLLASSETDREPFRVQLRDVEWQTLHIVNCSCSYATGGSGRN